MPRAQLSPLMQGIGLCTLKIIREIRFSREPLDLASPGDDYCEILPPLSWFGFDWPAHAKSQQKDWAPQLSDWHLASLEGREIVISNEPRWPYKKKRF